MKIKELDKVIVTEINKEISDAVEKIASKYGLSLKPKGARYDHNGMTVRCELQVNSKSGIDAKKYADNFKTHFRIYGCKLEWLNQTFTDKRDGKTFTFTGFDLGKRKNVVRLYEKSSGKIYITSIESLMHSMENYV